MGFHPFEANTPHVAYACLGGFVVCFSMFSSLAKEKLYIGEVVFATIFGIVVGPYGAKIFTPRSWGNIDDEVTNSITLEVMRVTLALGVFAIGVELPKSYLWKNKRSLALLVIPVMAWGWFVSAALIYAIFPGLTYLSALVISACLTPTDPVLAAAIVNGKYANKNVPGYLRRLIAAESAANDGLAYPFLFFSLYLTIDATTGEAIRNFFTIGILYSVVLGTVIGSFLGYGFNKLMRLMEKLGFIGSESYAVQFVALALFTIGVATVLGVDDLLAAFAAGSAVSWDGHFNEKSEDTMVFATIIEVMFNCAAFVFIGAWIRFEDFTVPSLHLSPLRLFGFFCSILFIRRIPLVLAVYRWIPDIRTWQQALFVGWFGPMGVGAVFISTYALTLLPQPAYPPTTQQEVLAGTIQPIVAFTILGSILVHGLSIPAFSMAKRINTMQTVSRISSTPEWLNQITHRDGMPPTNSRESTTSRPQTAKSGFDTLTSTSETEARIMTAAHPAAATDALQDQPASSSSVLATVATSVAFDLPDRLQPISEPIDGGIPTANTAGAETPTSTGVLLSRASTRGGLSDENESGNGGDDMGERVSRGQALSVSFVDQAAPSGKYGRRKNSRAASPSPARLGVPPSPQVVPETSDAGGKEKAGLSVSPSIPQFDRDNNDNTVAGRDYAADEDLAERAVDKTPRKFDVEAQ